MNSDQQEKELREALRWSLNHRNGHETSCNLNQQDRWDEAQQALSDCANTPEVRVEGEAISIAQAEINAKRNKCTCGYWDGLNKAEAALALPQAETGAPTEQRDALRELAHRITESIKGYLPEFASADVLNAVQSDVLAELTLASTPPVPPATCDHYTVLCKPGAIVGIRFQCAREKHADGEHYWKLAEKWHVPAAELLPPAAVSGERAVVLRHLAEEIHVEGAQRCAICFWPLVESADKGCVRGNCSMRGEPQEFERRSHRAKVDAILMVLESSPLLAPPNAGSELVHKPTCLLASTPPAAVSGEQAETAQVVETAWLIERRNPEPEWLIASSYGFEWTKDSLKAIRFSRREDANQIAEIFEFEDIHILEHQWG